MSLPPNEREAKALNERDRLQNRLNLALDRIRVLEAEIERLKEFEWMYEELCK